MVQFLFLTLSAWGGELTVDMLDVGQGDAILIRVDGHAALIDAGPRDADTVAQIRALGVESLDFVVATHPHADHIGLMAEVITSFDVDVYIDNGMTHTTKNYERVMAAVTATEVGYQQAKTGMAFELGDEATFTVLFPGDTLLSGTRSDLNSNSVVLRLDHGQISFLFTGDSEGATEGALLGADIKSVDVLKVAHHGSGHSSSGAFLAKLKPEAALISVGADNRYHHPYDEALDRLRTVGALVYRTDLSGNIRAVSDGNGVEILEGSLPELDLVKIVPWPDHPAVVDAEPEPQPTSEPKPAPSDVRGVRLKRRVFLDRLARERPNADRSLLIREWRAYKKAWRLATRLERKAHKQADIEPEV